MEKSRPNKDEARYREFALAHPHCQCCGLHESRSWPPLSNHHIIKSGRSHDWCNLLRLCGHPCHSLAEGLDVRDESTGLLIPKLTIGVCISIKLECDPDGFDLDRLRTLRGSRVPDPEPVPEFFNILFRMRTGVDRIDFRWHN